MKRVAGGGMAAALSGDGGQATAATLKPTSMALDPAGKLVVHDEQARTFRAVDLDTGIIDEALAQGSGSTERATIPAPTAAA